MANVPLVTTLNDIYIISQATRHSNTNSNLLIDSIAICNIYLKLIDFKMPFAKCELLCSGLNVPAEEE